jgi:NAD(P)-dependent dehydrogenase (short-subunit alcohol dehydrogenase family)
MKVLLVGASGTIGKHLYEYFSRENEVVSASRSGADVGVDITDQRSIEAMYEAVSGVDAVICAAGPAKFGPFASLTEDDFYIGIKGKMMGQVNLVRKGMNYLNDGGSFTLTSGILSEEPVTGSVAVSLLNGGLNSFVMAAAQEMPRGMRINIVSPTLVEDSVDVYGKALAGFDPAPMDRVVNGYVKSVEGRINGRIIRVY